MHALGNYQGIDVKMVDPQEIKHLHPLINTDGLVGGIYQRSDGSIDPTGKIHKIQRFFIPLPVSAYFTVLDQNKEIYHSTCVFRCFSTKWDVFIS